MRGVNPRRTQRKGLHGLALLQHSQHRHSMEGWDLGIRWHRRRLMSQGSDPSVGLRSRYSRRGRPPIALRYSCEWRHI